MRTLKTPWLASGVVLTTWSGLALAQPLPATPAPAPADTAVSATFDPQQLPAVRGELERLTLTPRGDIDGFILKDGTEVKTAPDLGAQIAFVLHAGDQLTVHGLKAAAIPLVRALSITDETTHRTILDSRAAPDMPPSRGPAPPLPPVGAATEARGTVRMTLHGPQGEVNGVLLDSGAILRFPPDPTGQLSSSLQPHQVLVAQGIAITNPLGTVIDVQQIGTSRDQLRPVGPALRPLDDRPPAGLPRRAAPPPVEPGALPPPPPAAGAAVPAAPPIPPSA